MKARRLIIISTSVAAILFGVYFATRQFFYRDRTIDTSKLIAALQAFSRDHATKGLRLPSEVPLQELIAGGYLTTADLRAFDGMQITFLVPADGIRPTQVLMEARLPDGSRIGTLADGSVQQLRRK